MAELAQAAHVSLATVDRALNGRERLRPETLAHIVAVAQSIGHPAAARFAGGGGGGSGLRRFGVVLHKQGQEFYKAFADELRRAAEGQGALVLEFSASQSPSDMAGTLRSMVGRCDVLAATAVNHAEITAAVEDLRVAGIAVHALLSEFAPGVRAGYLGLDNLKVGRIAGWVMQKSAVRPGCVAIFVGGTRWHGHDLRDQGFRTYLRDHAPHLTVLDTLINLETRQMTYEAVMTLLATRPDLRGIYVAGGGMEGAIAALRDAGSQVALVVSALTPESRRGLKGGQVAMVIDTPLEKLCRELVRRMATAPLNPMLTAPPQFLQPDLHIRESL